MVKIILIILLQIFLFGKIIKIEHATSINDIIKKLENIENGTFIKFENGRYDFTNKKIILKNKKYITFKTSEQTFFKNIQIIIENSDNIKIENFKLLNSSFNIKSTDNLLIQNTFFKNGIINIFYSTFGINNSLLKNYEINILDNSLGKIQNTSIYNKNIIIKNSKTLIENNEFLNSSVKIKQARIDINNNLFHDIKNTGIIILNSDVNIFNNNFKNIKKGIYITNSKINLNKNKFENVNLGFDIKTSIVSINDNLLVNIKKGHFGKATKNSKIYFNKNQTISIKPIVFSNLKNNKEQNFLFGILKRNIKIETDKIDIIIKKGTLLELNKYNLEIQKPTIYKGLIIPDLDYLNLDIKKIDSFIENNRLIYFKIYSNQKINNIYFDNVKLNIINNYPFKTKKILSYNLKNSKHSLLLEGKNFTLNYNCEFKNNKLQCIEKKLEEL